MIPGRNKVERINNGACVICGRNSPRPGRKTCQTCRDYTRQWQERNTSKVRGAQLRHLEKARERRLKAIIAYGGQCACCGEDRLVFLAIDHIDGIIPEDRKRTGSQLTRLLELQGWPPGYQVLCHNCNMAVRDGATCPHQVCA